MKGNLKQFPSRTVDKLQGLLFLFSNGLDQNERLVRKAPKGNCARPRYHPLHLDLTQAEGGRGGGDELRLLEELGIMRLKTQL